MLYFCNKHLIKRNKTVNIFFSLNNNHIDAKHLVLTTYYPYLTTLYPYNHVANNKRE